MLFRKFFKSWFFEIAVVVLLLLGIYFYQRISISLDQPSIYISDFGEWLIMTWFAFIDWYNNLLSGNYMEIIAIILASAIFIYVIFIRIRWRIRRSERFTATDCPKCNYPLSRIKRTEFQRMISNILPIRRLFCKKCRWKGTRIKPIDSVFKDSSTQQHLQSRTEPIKSVD